MFKVFAVLHRWQISRQLFKYQNYWFVKHCMWIFICFMELFMFFIALCAALHITNNWLSCCGKCDCQGAAVVIFVWVQHTQTVPEQSTLGFGQILSWFQAGGFSCSLGRVKILIQMQDNIVVVRNDVLQCREPHSCGGMLWGASRAQHKVPLLKNMV